jgi:hypothetical protein
VVAGGITGLIVAFGLARLFGVAEVSQGIALIRRVLRRRFGRKA